MSPERPHQSGCGKTTTAMAGNHFIGDDLAQMWIDEAAAAIRSVNPECGIFGIVEDVNLGRRSHAHGLPSQ
jgi:phosphoenolpyruvate carboxykinase (GTP)